jgi:energy-converting hydrogenase Eha subunit A
VAHTALAKEALHTPPPDGPFVEPPPLFFEDCLVSLPPCPLRLISSCVGLILSACLRWLFPRKQPAVPRRSAPTEKLRRFSWGPSSRFGCPCVPVGSMLDLCVSRKAGPTTLFDIGAAVALGGVVATASLYRDGVHCDPGLVRCRGCPVLTYAVLPSKAVAFVSQHILYLRSGSHPDG